MAKWRAFTGRIDDDWSQQTPAQLAAGKLASASALRSIGSNSSWATTDEELAERWADHDDRIAAAERLEAEARAELLAVWRDLTWPERALICYGGQHGGMVYDGGEYGPECGTLVERGLVGEYEVALTLAGRCLAELALERQWVADDVHVPAAHGQ